MKRWLLGAICLIGVLILAMSLHATGRAQSFTAMIYLPTIRYDDPCASMAMPFISRPATQERIAVFHSNYQSLDTPDLYIGNAGDTGRTRLTNNSAVEGRVTWSPDGTQIAYKSSEAGSTSLNIMRIADKKVTIIHTWPSNTTIADPASSPDGKKIVFEIGQYMGNWNIAIIQTNGADLHNLTDTGENHSPSWSPDGTQIVFSSNRGGFSHLYQMQADGTYQTQLTNQPIWDFEPAWSPDGTRIAFRSGCMGAPGGGHESIYIIHADGSGRVHIPIPAEIYSDIYSSQTQPSWSPDSTRIAFTHSFFKGNAIYIVNLDGSGYSGFGTQHDNSPSWAPR